MNEQQPPIERICAGCGTRGPGMFPPGWTITPVYGLAGGARTAVVVGERPLCPECQETPS